MPSSAENANVTDKVRNVFDHDDCILASLSFALFRTLTSFSRRFRFILKESRMTFLNALGSCLEKLYSDETYHSDETKFTYADRASTTVVSRACAKESVFTRCLPISQGEPRRNT